MDPLKLYLHLEDQQSDRYRIALRRVCGVTVIEDLAVADAVVSKDERCVINKPMLWIEGDSPAPRESVVPAMPWRFRPSVLVMSERLRSGKLGVPGLLRVHRWRADADLLADIDLALWLVSGEPETVFAMARDGYRQAHLGFSGGGMVIVDHATNLPSGGYESVTLIGSKGAAYADDHRNVNLRLVATGCEGITTGEGDVALANMLNDFVTSVREDRQGAVTMSDFEKAARVRDRVLESTSKEAVV